MPLGTDVAKRTVAGGVGRAGCAGILGDTRLGGVFSLSRGTEIGSQLGPGVSGRVPGT